MSDGGLQLGERTPSAVKPSTVLGSAVQGPVSDDSLLRRLTQFYRTSIEIPITIRRTRGGGTFDLPITCYPGVITVIDSDSSLAPFEDYEIRAGEDVLHPSEIYCAGDWELPTLGDTPEEMLRRAGVAPADVPAVLDKLGLSERSAIQHDLLSRAELKALGMYCSVWVKCPLVYLHLPFAGLSNDTGDRLAAVLLLTVKERGISLVVTGAKRLPSPWKSASNVRRESFAEKRRTTRWGKVQGEVTKVGKLLFGLRGDALQSNVIRTLPQVLVGPAELPKRHVEEVAFETIRNPGIENVSVEPGEWEDLGYSMLGENPKGDAIRRARPKRPTLTNVNVVYRAMYRVGLFDVIRRVTLQGRIVRRSMKQRRDFELLPPSKKLIAVKEAFRFRRIIVALAGCATILAIVYAASC